MEKLTQNKQFSLLVVAFVAVIALLFIFAISSCQKAGNTGSTSAKEFRHMHPTTKTYPHSYANLNNGNVL